MSDILTGFNMQGNDPIDDRIVSKSNLETLEQYLNRVPVQKRYYGLTFFALDKNNELRKYTFQTSLIEPTIDDDEEEIERIDKELQEHVSNKAIHKTSEEIRSEIVDADIPDTIARVQWTLDQINTAVINLIGGASDEYNTLKRIQTKIEELRAEMESQLYGDDGGTVLKTLEQALKFLNQYKDFIVDIPDNFVSKQDIVDNLTTDDPTKVLSAKQGKVLSDTLTNYFESAMQSIRTETDRAINAENRIETKLDKEIERSTNEDIRIDNKLDSEINRSIAEDDRLDKKIDAETTRATTAESNLNTKIETETDRAEGEESRIETKLDNEITRSTNKDTEHDNRNFKH
jgi:predicted  nucleic acid-binding Zn-ribbon protein